jgi:hypothetical protein
VANTYLKLMPNIGTGGGGGPVVGDNLGDHLATMNLDLALFDIDNVGWITLGDGTVGASRINFSNDGTHSIPTPGSLEIQVDSGSVGGKTFVVNAAGVKLSIPSDNNETLLASSRQNAAGVTAIRLQAGISITDATASLVTVENAGTDVLRITPTGGLQPEGFSTFNSGVAFKRTATAGNYTSAGESLIAVTDTTVARTITLSATDLSAGAFIDIKDESGTCSVANPIIVTPAAGTLDGVASVSITVPYGVLRVYSSLSNWFTR